MMAMTKRNTAAMEAMTMPAMAPPPSMEGSGSPGEGRGRRETKCHTQTEVPSEQTDREQGMGCLTAVNLGTVREEAGGCVAGATVANDGVSATIVNAIV